ncbi:hypothetical protein GP486_006469 [Trichoglossum hirsutum]|uniref:CST complex subunit STN1 n=1 Tax=Trichoglossum hirsutum TaxID=265104 RepID=A0A9P8L3N5_9PEZI|nr:hypothetical protein GP486_006469 [Trichoglossum hirsutum]
MTTTTPPPGQLEFYPSYCFASASPTYGVWAKLTAADVHRLSERKEFVAQNIYFYLNHPIRWVCVTGVVVAVDEYDRRTVLSLDDGSGEGIEAVCEKPQPPVRPASNDGDNNDDKYHNNNNNSNAPTEPDIDTGTVVRAKGSISTFRNVRQILAKRIEILPDTQSEVRAWRAATKFEAEVLVQPWVLCEEEIQDLWRRACGEEKETTSRKNAERKKSRRKRRPELPPPPPRESRRVDAGDPPAPAATAARNTSRSTAEDDEERKRKSRKKKNSHRHHRHHREPDTLGP